MAVPFLIPLPLLIAVPLILLIATVGAPALPRLIRWRRQAAYDAAVAPNMVRLELTVGRGRSNGPDAAVAAIRGSILIGGWASIAGGLEAGRR